MQALDAPRQADPPSLDRSIVDGPLGQAVWRIAWPTLLQNVVAGLQGVVDHMMVGRLVGYQGNAAIGVSWQIFLVVVVFIASLSSGMGVLVARFAGRGDPRTVNRVVYQGLLAGFALYALVLAPAGYLFAPDLLAFVNAEPNVQAEALPYLRIMFLYSFGMLVFFLLSGALRAAGDARTPLRLGVAMTALNLVLNMILIRGLGPIPAFGTRGAAMGTVAAAAIVSAAAFYLLFGHKLVVQFSKSMDWKPDPTIIRELFRFGLPTGFQGIAMNIGGILMVRYVGSLAQSGEAQAAFAVGYTQLFSLVSWTAVALMSATATVAGQNLGAGKPERTERTPLHAAALGLVVAIPLSVLFKFAPQPLLGVFGLDQPGVLPIGAQLLGYLAVSAPFLMTALTYTGALQGTGDTRGPMYISIISQLALPLGLCAMLDAWRGLTPADIWSAIVIGHMTRCALSVLRFRQGRWRHIDVSVRGTGGLASEPESA
jgi:putative MATE family efflux protein